ncbi:MAG: DUF2070 family protein [Candidatus Micrarchaeia archaeon]
MLAVYFILTLLFPFIISLASRKMKFRHLLATYIFSNTVLSAFLLLSFLEIKIIAIGVGFLFALWFLLGVLVFGQKYNAPMLGCIYLLFQIPVAAIFSDVALFVVDSLIASIIFLAGVFAIFMIINAPVRRAFGVTGVSLVSMFFAQWLRGTKELEGIFAKFAERINTNIDIICFRRSDKVKKELLTFIVPHLHYGPFGNLGGSEFPHLIARRMTPVSKYDNTFVFHGTATHDFNPIRSDDVDIVVRAVKEAAKKIKFRPDAVLMHGCGKESSAIGLVSRDAGFFILTHAPKVTEDIDFSVGLALRNYAEKFIDKAVIIDAHNAETGELMHVESGNPLVFDYQSAIEDALQKKLQKNLKYDRLEMGVSSLYPRLHSIGRAGVKVALFKTGRKEFALVVIDANGITPGFRNKILHALKEIGIDGEVCTTDTHSVNVVRGVINPLDSEMSDYEEALLIHDILDTILSARRDLSHVEFGIESKMISIDVFGPKRSAELVNMANSIAAVLKWAAPSIFFICGIVSYIIIAVI